MTSDSFLSGLVMLQRSVFASGRFKAISRFLVRRAAKPDHGNVEHCKSRLTSLLMCSWTTSE